MNSLLRFCVCLALGACAVHALTADVLYSYVEAFNQYQIKFDKHYGSQEEYQKRLEAYANSMEEIKRLNALNDGIVYGETSLCDALEEESTTHAVRVRADPEMMKKRGTPYTENTFPQPKLAQDHTKDNIPDEFNWFNVSGVKHPAVSQGSCGSCWAFAAAGALEMQAVLEGLPFKNVSRQQCIDCGSKNHTVNGCCGGFPGDAYGKIVKYAYEDNYPYMLGDWRKPTMCSPGNCSASVSNFTYEIVGYDTFFPMTSEGLKEQIWMYGPISVYMESVKELSYYKGGIFDCTGKTVSGGHYVVAVGFGPGYIAIRNSWGPDWGMEGDFLLSDRSYEASCKMLTPEIPQYIQMARVCVKNGAIRVLPILTLVMMIIQFALLL